MYTGGAPETALAVGILQSCEYLSVVVSSSSSSHDTVRYFEHLEMYVA